MKKIISLILSASLLLSSAAILGSCGIKNKKTGTELAKLMLANERMDQTVLIGGVDIGLNFSTATAEGFVSLPMAFSNGGGSKYSWSDFGAFSSSMHQFESFFINIDNHAKNVADEIMQMKESVGIVDKWVGDGEMAKMLRVYENSDLLLTYHPGSIGVYKRYTNDDATNVYEMYSFWDQGGGESGDVRMLLIPGERYEYMYNHENGFTDYVIMENTRGYWVCTRFNYGVLDNGAIMVSFTPTVFKDDLCYSAFISYRTDIGDSVSYTVADTKTNRELVSMTKTEFGYGMSLYLSGVKSGLISVGSDEAYEFDGALFSSTVNVINSVKGKFNALEFDKIGEGEIGFTGGYIDYNYLFNVQTGSLSFLYMDTEGTSADAFSAFEGYVNEMGLTLYRSVDDVSAAMQHAFLLADQFGKTFEWNGYYMDGIDSLEKGIDVLEGQFESAMAEYNGVKDKEIVSGGGRVSLPDSFAELEVGSMGTGSYNDGRITLSGITASIPKSDFLEDGESYALKVALSLCDENGNPISVNTIPLDGGNAPATTVSGERVALMASGEYSVPKNLSRGRYALVVYGATADEGIRVTEMVKIGSFSAVDESLESDAMDIRVTSVESGLYVRYSIKNSYRLSVSATKSSYTIAELEQMINVEILRKGAPYFGAVLENADGSEITAASLGKGSYRMLCYLSTDDGLAEAYIYLDLK